MRRRHRILTPLLALGLAFGVAGLTAVPAAEACMALPRRPELPTAPVAKVETAAAKFLFAQDGDQVTAHIQINYYGDAKDFSWVTPIPAAPTLAVGSDKLFTALKKATQPQFNLEWLDDEGTCKQRPSSTSAGAPAASKRAPAPAAGAAAPEADVQVVSRQQVGPYDSVVLKSDNAEALKNWLDENGYQVPPKLNEVMANYVSADYHFVALKLQQDLTAGDLQPIVLKYKADRPGIPVRLTSLGATPDMDVLVWVLGQHRAVPENYNLTEINEARIDWMNEGDNYRQVVTEAMNESGGRSFVTDYAGPSNVVPLSQVLDAPIDPEQLRSETDPVSFINIFKTMDVYKEGAASSGAPGSKPRGRTLAFLKRHVPKPALLANVSDEEFYGNPAAYREQVSGDATFVVDTAKAVKELEDTVVAPQKAMSDMFAAHPYMTALYTTMSPDEMKEDPTFFYNPDMEKVANVHQAEIRKLCNPNVYASDAPYKITLANKISFLISNGETENATPPRVGGKAAKIPAAQRVMRCGLVGRPDPISDYTSQITKSLNDLLKQGVVLQIRTRAGANPSAGAGTTVVLTIPIEELLAAGVNTGFGCTGCAQMNVPTPPVQRGSGEGLAYALTFLGFFGYRRWLGRKKP